MKNFLYNVDFICRRPHFKNNTEAAVSILNIYRKGIIDKSLNMVRGKDILLKSQGGYKEWREIGC